MNILIVEDEKDMNKIITKRLEQEGYTCESVYDGESAFEFLRYSACDAVIMDVMLPKLNGFEVLGKMRLFDIQTPVMFLTACSDTEDIVRGLDRGASDYMVKPFDFDELLARLRVLLRKAPDNSETVYRCGDLEVNVVTHSARRGKDKLNLSTKEFAVLAYMIRNQNIVLSRAQIEANVWHMDSELASNVIDVYIRYLRRKVDEDYEQKLIHTIRGVGYILKCDH